MQQPLVAEALSQSWGNPDPFNHVIIRPARLTPLNGAMQRFRYAWTTYAMPNGTSSFHVFQTGQISPQMLNLFAATPKWQLLSDSCMATSVMAHVHTQLGVVLPNTRIWYRWADRKNVFFAVEINQEVAIDWSAPELFVRLYKNAFFESTMAGSGDGLTIAGGVMTSSSDITTLQGQLNAIVNATGYNNGAIAFVNGARVNSISVITAKVGDVAEFVYDTSIYKVVDFVVNDLPTFLSTLDNKSKRLLHYNAADETLIDFAQDIDFYMWHAVTGKGYYLHKNAANMVRQLTHKDYAISADYLPPYYDNFKDADGFLDTSQLRLRMYVRYSGQGSMPKLESNLSEFMMDLPDLAQVQAMVGVNSSFPLWQAAKLEASAFMELIRAPYNAFTSALVEKAYGYYRVNTVLGPSILKIGSSGQLALPPAFQHTSTAYEYDSAGVLLGNYSVADQILYIRVNSTCALVEFVEGSSGKSIEEFYGSNPISLEDGVNYRFYLRVLDAQLNQPVWQDVTGTTHYTVDNGVANWGPNTITNSLDRLVRSDKKFLDYEATLSLENGLLVHQINYDKITFRGVINSPLDVPLGALDVWLNDRPLVRGVDYLVNFPTLGICNKAFLDTSGSAPHMQKLRVRMTGFCDPQLQINPLEEVGFVFNGVLSADARHELHREKIQRIVLNGALMAVQDVVFMEDGSSAQVLGSAVEGKPYEIRDVINHLPTLIQSEPYALYYKSRADLLAAESYVSQRVIDAAVYPISPITSRYQLFSPFLSKILTDLVAGYIDLSDFTQPYSDTLVRSLCLAYIYLLPMDPIGPGNLPDVRYTVIHPHPYPTQVSLSLLEYAFFERVVAIFATDKVVYSSLVNLAP